MSFLNTLGGSIMGFRLYIANKWRDIVSVGHIKIYLAIIVIMNISLWLLVFAFNRQAGQDLIALHYNIDFGVNLLGPSSRLYILPGSGLLVALVNFCLAMVLYRHRDAKFFQHCLFIAVIIAHIFLYAGLASVYLINFR